jgi:hypothetical protein
MVAITTDTNAAPYLGHRPRPQHVDAPRRPRPAASGQPAVPAALGARALLVVAALFALVLVAVATAGVGRILDGQRGIPASASAPAVTTTS